MKNLLLLLNKFEKNDKKYSYFINFIVFLKMQLKKTTYIITHRQFITTIHQYDKESLPNIILVKKHYANVNCK